ncbi:hypothetical protein N7G274_004570 [Stereocaulon virgatum]|uniref:Major facilitator superfamily (MFS) profile domain-containing protein n=1 Tax=Stereocaulon virgatum TaxID=373712 RepID=A0ABR4AD73_9LECA
MSHGANAANGILSKEIVIDALSPPIEEAIPSPPPDGGYGWVVLAAYVGVNAFTWGVVASYGVYLAYYLANDVYPGASDIDFAFIGGLNFSSAMLVAPLVTIFARKCGTQVPMATGAVIMSAGFISASFGHGIWQLFLTQGVLVGFGVGFISTPSIAVLPQWFDKKRSLANGIGSAGSGIGGLIFSFGTQAMIDNISLAWSLRITGIIVGVMNLITALTVRNRNTIIKPPQRGFDTKLLRRYDVLLLLAWGFISMFGYTTLLFSLSDFARSIGLSAKQASSITAFLNLGTALGRPMIGVISDNYGRLETAGIITFVCGTVCFTIWLPDRSYGVTIFFAIVVGAILGVFWMTAAPICVEVVGLVELPSMLSLTWMSIVLPTTFSEAIALKLRRPGSGHEYLYAQIFAGLAYFIASGCMYELRRLSKRKKSREDCA